MRINFRKTLLLLSSAITTPATGIAQDQVVAGVDVDLVSGYIWRGQDLGGVSIQPSVCITYKDFSLEAWGSVGLDKEDDKEFDLTLGYTSGSFSLSITDYWFASYGENNPYFHYGARSTAHVFEAQIGYDFGLLTLNWYTNFAGADGVNKNGDRAYSSYISATAPFKLGGLDCTAEIGATPWANSFYNSWTNDFAVCDISVEASKEIRITDSFSVPILAKITWNPCTEGAYFIFGLSL